MRGSNTLFADIFNGEPVPPKQKKGRSEELHLKRTELLINRYYFYGKNTGLRYEFIIKMLSAEFFLAEATITDLISDHYDKLKELRAANPTPADLRKKFPWLNWSPGQCQDLAVAFLNIEP